MKNAEELFEEFAEVEYDGEGALLVEGFEDALTEHDAEIKALIDEERKRHKIECYLMLNQEKPEQQHYKAMELILKAVDEALTELKEKL